jgi:hypothetical protein
MVPRVKESVKTVVALSSSAVPKLPSAPVPVTTRSRVALAASGMPLPVPLLSVGTYQLVTTTPLTSPSRSSAPPSVTTMGA